MLFSCNFQQNGKKSRLNKVYNDLNIPLAGHELRASLENDLKLISEGRKTKEEVLSVQLAAYEDAYAKVDRSLSVFYQRMTEFYGSGNQDDVTLPQGNIVESVTKCPGKRFNDVFRLFWLAEVHTAFFFHIINQSKLVKVI